MAALADESGWTPEVDAWNRELGDLRLRYCPVYPHAKQELFLLQDAFEVFFGGAAGPGKSWALLMAALQYADVDGYHALLVRPTLGEFEKPGGLIEVAHDWLSGTRAWWNGTRREWRFPEGASLGFGYLRTLGHLQRYKGPSYSFLGFDELTSFTEALYRGMFRVLRQAKGGPLDHVPVRVRSASNPGGIGHAFAKARFVSDESREPGVVYVPATIHDNPSLDYETYLRTLEELGPVERMRLINGDWDVQEEGEIFDRDKLKVIEPEEAERPTKVVRYWDLAATKPSDSNPDPDWTVGVRLELQADGLWTIRHIARLRDTSEAVEKRTKQMASEDGQAVPVYIEQDPGQAGKAQVSHYQRNVLRGYACHAGLTRIKGKPASKAVRAAPVAAAVNNGLVRIVNGPNVREFIDTLAIFPHDGYHDDDVDALSGAHNAISHRGAGGRSTSHVPRGRIAGVGESAARR